MSPGSGQEPHHLHDHEGLNLTVRSSRRRCRAYWISSFSCGARLSRRIRSWPRTGSISAACGTDDLPADGITRASGIAPRPPAKFQPAREPWRSDDNDDPPHHPAISSCRSPTASHHLRVYKQPERPPVLHPPGRVDDRQYLPGVRTSSLLAVSTHRRCGAAGYSWCAARAVPPPRPPAGPRCCCSLGARQAGRPPIARRTASASGSPRAVADAPPRQHRDLRVAHRRAAAAWTELDGHPAAHRFGQP